MTARAASTCACGLPRRRGTSLWARSSPLGVRPGTWSCTSGGPRTSSAWDVSFFRSRAPPLARRSTSRGTASSARRSSNRRFWLSLRLRRERVALPGGELLRARRGLVELRGAPPRSRHRARARFQSHPDPASIRRQRRLHELPGGDMRSHTAASRRPQRGRGRDARPRKQVLLLRVHRQWRRERRRHAHTRGRALRLRNVPERRARGRRVRLSGAMRRRARRRGLRRPDPAWRRARDLPPLADGGCSPAGVLLATAHGYSERRSRTIS